MLTILRRDYAFTVTSDPDGDFVKYLQRRLRPYTAVPARIPPPGHMRVTPLDISYDDPEGDVVAGLSALMWHNQLYIDMLWVESDLRGRGIGQRLVHMAEAEAARRGCTQARAVAGTAGEFYQKLGYVACGRLQDLHSGALFTWFDKHIAREDSAQKDLA